MGSPAHIPSPWRAKPVRGSAPSKRATLGIPILSHRKCTVGFGNLKEARNALNNPFFQVLSGADIGTVVRGIADVENDISAVTKQIGDAEHKVAEAVTQGDTGERDYWRREKEQLRRKEEQLREQLRREQELMLQAQIPTG